MSTNTNDDLLTVENVISSKFVLTCGEIHPRFKSYAIQTTDKEIKECIKSQKDDRKEKIIRLSLSCYAALTQFTDEDLHQHFLSNNQDWKNWCNDVLIFLVVRFLLFDKPIPICPLSCNYCNNIEKKTKKCGGCNQRYCSSECQKADWKEHKKICR